ncbi:hypothetical protein [Epilithonimonas mollis]|uniref:Uncharacterized protein n=1 Tax=Epilithonimonas mollis TaxID=216903 RepID=A0A1M6UJP7_9FLAO|nr:hypothetical protein [Epilithonimonas mollis]SHK69338.1 hypothetical protein SAMN05444371_3328 [Epilithonimonas mollis]
MKKFRKRVRIQNATAFKLEYFEGKADLKEKEFKTYKSMEQFHSRQTKFMYLALHRYAFVDGKWHRFIKVTDPFIFQAELDSISKQLNENFEVENLQSFKSEENQLQIIIENDN